jgi:putative membrane protein
MNKVQFARRACLCAVLLGPAACARDRAMHPKIPETTSAEMRGPVRPPGLAEGEPGSLAMPPGAKPDYSPSDNTGTASATTGYTDDQILQIMHVTNLGERDAAQLAQTKGKDPRVKLFAGMMLREHGDADTKAFDLTRRLKLTLADSTLSTQLGNDSHVTAEQLRSLNSGDDFDRTYLTGQIKAHQTVLDTIDQKLLPNAKSAEVREFLGSTRSKVEAHLHEAESLQRSLDSK